MKSAGLKLLFYTMSADKMRTPMDEQVEVVYPMAMDRDGRRLPYAVFVRGVLASLAPYGNVDPAVLFGDPLRLENLDIFIEDQCDLYAAHGECFRALGARNAGTFGLAPSEFEARIKVVKGYRIPFTKHSVYRRNLRRWSAGQLPRKRKARADFVLLATLWATGWGDPDDPRAVECRRVMSECLNEFHAESMGLFDAKDVDEVLAIIHKVAEAAYRGSLAVVRTGQ